MSTKSLRRMATPLVVSFTARFLFTFVDIAYAAVIDDSNAAVAAIGFFAPIQSVFIAIWAGLSAGFTASIAHAMGAGDRGRVTALKRAMVRILIVLIPSLALTIGGGVQLVVPWLDLEPRFADAFTTYATTIGIGMPLFGFLSIYPDSIVKAHQETRSTMVAGLASTVANVILNTLFVFGFGLGIFGIALATVLSRLAGLGYAMHRAGILERAAGAEAGAASRAWPSPYTAILQLAAPGALAWLLQAGEQTVVNKVLAGLPDATTAIATYGVFNQLLMLALMPTTACAIAVVPWVARLMPAGERIRIGRELGQVLAGLLGIALVMTLMMGFVFAAPLAEFFVAQKPGADPAAPSPALGPLRFLPIAALAAIPFLLLRPFFEGAHRPRIGMSVSIVRFGLLGPPLIWWSPAVAAALGLRGVEGVILGVATAAAIAAAWTASRARAVLRAASAP